MPFLAPIGIALGFTGAAAAVAGTVATGLAVAGVGEGIALGINSASQASQAKKASEAAANQQASATAALQTAQDTASTQAQGALTAKRQAAAASTDIFTSPLGLTTQASTARKTLTGQ